jgi:uncharacterized protein DUF6457
MASSSHLRRPAGVPAYYRATDDIRTRSRRSRVNDWIDELAAAFGEDPLSDAETRQLLRVSRDVAHRVERKGTPLAAFLLGSEVARRVAAGAARDVALDEAIERIDTMLPPAPEPA